MNTSFSLGKKTVLLIATLCLFSAVFAGAAAFLAGDQRVVYGVRAENCDLNGMSKAEARQFFEKAGQLKLDHQVIQLTDGIRSWQIRPEEIRLSVNAEKAAEAAYDVGRSGRNPLENLLARIQCAKYGREIDMDAGYDEALLLAKLEAIAAEIHTDPVNAYCSLNSDGTVRQIAGIVGKKMDAKELCDKLAGPLKKLKLPKLEIHPEDQQPFVRTEDIMGVDSVLASYTTYFSPGDRGDNIALAAGCLDGVLVKSGQIFSFNDTVGSRTYNAGYKNAGVIIEGRLEEDVGGGVCQVSSTLYNAVLLAGLEPTVRAAHFSPSSYCPPGRDATVADGLLDFKFQNQLPHNVYLISRAYGSELTIYILGTWSDLEGNTITLETEGSRMQPSVYRVYRRGGEVVEREYLHTDSYSEPITAERADTPL